MKKTTKKLAISRETIRNLDRVELTAMRGGLADWSNSECKTTYTWVCTVYTCGTVVG